MAEYKNGFTPGRKPGATNLKTRERTRIFREMIEKHDVIGRLITGLVKDLDESGDVRFADKVNAIKALAPYMVNSVSNEIEQEQIEAIATHEDAERRIAELQSKIDDVTGAA